MQTGGKGVGIHKHRIAGHATKSPKLRMALRLAAQQNDRKAPKPLPYGSIRDLMKGKGT